jgi:hypothetical protein
MGFNVALPLTVLPDISPRKRGERRRPQEFRQSATSAIGEIDPVSVFSPFTGRRCRQADEGRRRAKNISAIIIVLASTLSLAACQSEKKPPANAGSGKSAALRTMEQVSIAAHKCWFASKDPAFRPYRFANELNSMSGQPRFLLVPAKNFGGLPALVVQARGNSSQVEVFGPLTSEPLGSRISADIDRWRSGDQGCGSAA